MSIHADRIQEAEREAAQAPPVALTAKVRKMFQYSAYVDVGEGARECEHSRDGACESSDHFHAWCRLPNPYQHTDIREKGLAARARRIRQLRDPASDHAVILDESLSAIEDPIFTAAIVDELLAREWAEDYLEAERETKEREEFAQIDQDRQEYQRLKITQAGLEEDQRSAEYTELLTHLGAYVSALQERLVAIQEPKRAALLARPPEQIVALVRSARVEEQAAHAFNETYNAWMWFVGTFEVAKHPTLGRPYQPKWQQIGSVSTGDPGTMYGESPEVIDALKDTFNTLQMALQQGSSGN